MTIATTDLTNWLGTTLAATLSVNQIASALADGNRYCNGKIQELGISGHPRIKGGHGTNRSRWSGRSSWTSRSARVER